MKIPKDATKGQRKAFHQAKMARKKAQRAMEHDRYLRSNRAKQVARWAAHIRANWHKSIWPAEKVARRAGQA